MISCSDIRFEEQPNVVPKCTSLVPLSPEEEKIIRMESAGEDLRRCRRMKPLQPPDNMTSESEEAVPGTYEFCAKDTPSMTTISEYFISFLESSMSF